MSKESTILSVLDSFFKVLEPNEEAQSSRVLKREIRFMERKLNKKEKDWRKDGLSEVEEKRLEELREAIHKKYLQL